MVITLVRRAVAWKDILSDSKSLNYNPTVKTPIKNTVRDFVHHVTKPLKKHGIRIGQGNRVLVKPAARSGARNSGREYTRNVKIEYSDTRCAHKLQTGCASHVAKHGHDNHIQASLSSVHCAPTLAPVRRRGCCTECAESCWYWGTCKSLLPGTRGGVALTREPAADSS